MPIFPGFSSKNPPKKKTLNSVPKWALKYAEDIAVVERKILPTYKGRVRYQGNSWLAQCESNLSFDVGERVRVVARRSLTLIVEPLAISQDAA